MAPNLGVLTTKPSVAQSSGSSTAKATTDKKRVADIIAKASGSSLTKGITNKKRLVPIVAKASANSTAKAFIPIPKVLFVCKYLSGAYGDYNTDTQYSYPNCAYGLWNSAKFMVNYLTSVKIPASLVTAIDANSIDRLVTENNPDIVMIEALWVTPEKLDELIGLRRHRKRTWIVRTHSDWSFISGEGMAVTWLKAYKKLQDKYPRRFYLAPNTVNMTNEEQSFLNLATVYLPNVYCPSQPKSIHKPNVVTNDTINIASFGALRPLKNSFIQALVAIEIADSLGHNLNFHINATTIEVSCNPILKNIRALFHGDNKHKLVEHGWEDHSTFMNTVATMNLGLQISFTETFNIVAADFVWNALPIVTSPAIYWLPATCKTSTTSITNIVTTALYCWTHQNTIVAEAQNLLALYNSNAGKIWQNSLLQIG